MYLIHRNNQKEKNKILQLNSSNKIKIKEGIHKANKTRHMGNTGLPSYLPFSKKCRGARYP